MMTPRQIENTRKKIKSIRSALAAERRRFGGYMDSQGLRYAPPALFIKIQDYKGGLTYLRWFAKNFPDDIGMPDFLFEWMIILFKNKKLKDAERKAFHTWFANTYLFDKYFERKIVPIAKYEYSNLTSPGFADYLIYSSEQKEFADFSQWLALFEDSDHFRMVKNNFIKTSKKLALVTGQETRLYLLAHLRQIANEID